MVKLCQNYQNYDKFQIKAMQFEAIHFHPISSLGVSCNYLVFRFFEEAARYKYSSVTVPYDFRTL